MWSSVLDQGFCWHNLLAEGYIGVRSLLRVETAPGRVRCSLVWSIKDRVLGGTPSASQLLECFSAIRRVFLISSALPMMVTSSANSSDLIGVDYFADGPVASVAACRSSPGSNTLQASQVFWSNGHAVVIDSQLYTFRFKFWIIRFYVTSVVKIIWDPCRKASSVIRYKDGLYTILPFGWYSNVPYLHFASTINKRYVLPKVLLEPCRWDVSGWLKMGYKVSILAEMQSHFLITLLSRYLPLSPQVLWQTWAGLWSDPNFKTVTVEPLSICSRAISEMSIANGCWESHYCSPRP